MYEIRDITLAIVDYVNRTSNHVLIRVTPIYSRENLVASGVQMEAYSIEDNGVLSFNVYLYNVQPGIDINYLTGTNYQADTVINEKKILGFATYNANESNPDLMLEFEKHLEILFSDQQETNTYKSLINNLRSIAQSARALSVSNKSAAKQYGEMKVYQYCYLETLIQFVPILLANEDFFSEVFK